MERLEERVASTLLSQTVTNPRETINVITLESNKQLDKPQSIPKNNTSKEGTRKEEMTINPKNII